jgi:resuscitation-promoting factor RpfB
LNRRRTRLALHDHAWAFVSALLSFSPSIGTLVLLVMLVSGLALVSVYFATQHNVAIEINGTLMRHRTHERSVQGVLREMGVVLQDKDRLSAPSEEELLRGAPVQLTIARQVLLIHDGSVTQVRTHAGDVGGALADTGIVILPHDRLLTTGKPCNLDTPLPAPKAPKRQGAKALLDEIRRPVRLDVQRAVALSVQDGAVPINFYTTARTVGEALFEGGFVIYQGDRVFPELATGISPGLAVSIERSKPVTLDVGGAKKALRTRLKAVGELLQAEGVALGPKDYVLPDPRSALSRDLSIAVVRVFDEYLVEETPIPYETRWEPEPAMEIDQRQVKRWGREGAKRQRVRMHYENGREIYRVEEEEWIAREPLDRINNYGTQVVLRMVDTPSGPLTYWRKLRMLATSYNAPTSGTAPGRPWYGMTRLGLRARKGIVAIDPGVINLGQNVYVPGYGSATAADTGNAITGRRIDLCYDDNNLELWYRWVDVYILTPVPAYGETNWIIPNSPQEKG